MNNSDEKKERQKKEKEQLKEWYKEYKKLNNKPLEMCNSLEQIIQLNPKYLRQDKIVDEMFELNVSFFNNDLDSYPHYIDFLVRLRNNFSKEYKRIFGFFDKHIIEYLVFQKRNDEIKKYLNLFIEFPMDFLSYLYEIMELCIFTDNDDLVHFTLKDIYHIIYNSEKMIDTDIFIDMIIDVHFSKLLKNNCSDEEFTNYISELEKIDKQIPDFQIFLNKEHWRKTLQNLVTPFPKDVNVTTLNKELKLGYFSNICGNYTIYLTETVGMNKLKANSYTDFIITYLLKVNKRNSNNPSPFIFSYKRIKKITFNACTELFNFNAIKAINYLNAMYYFAEFLVSKEAISSSEKDKVGKITAKLYNKIMESLGKMKGELNLLSSFPFV